MSGLPRDSATARAAREEGDWTADHELLAVLIETLDGWGQALAAYWTAKPGQRVAFPPTVSIEHPDRPQAGEKRPEIETDPNRIAALIRGLGGTARRG